MYSQILHGSGNIDKIDIPVHQSILKEYISTGESTFSLKFYLLSDTTSQDMFVCLCLCVFV